MSNNNSNGFFSRMFSKKSINKVENVAKVTTMIAGIVTTVVSVIKQITTKK